MPADNRFDEQLKASFEANNFEYNPAHWQEMSAKLDALIVPEKKRSIALWPIMGIAAAIALLIATPLIFRISNNGNNAQLKTVKSLPAVNPMNAAPINKTVLAPIIVLPAAAQKTSPPALFASRHRASPQASEQGIPVDYSHVIPPSPRPPALSSPSLIGSSAENQLKSSTDGTKPSELITRQTNNPATSDPLINPAGSSKKDPLNPSLQSKIDAYKNDGNGANAPIPDIAGINHQSGLSVAGGYNYGSLNSGYVLGIAAHHNLNDHFYVEGNLAFVNSTSKQSANVSGAQYNAIKVQNTGNLLATAPSYASTPALPEAVNNNLYYLQFTPTLHCNVTRILKAGVGADYQRLLQGSSDQTIQINDDQIKLVPSNDFGIVGKAEAAVSQRLQLGVMYRQGVNNLLNNTDQYMNRKYVQLQLKFLILGK